MRVIFKDAALVVAVETEAEREAFAVWRTAKKGHVFFFDGGAEKGGALIDLGPRDDACREPINILFDQSEARWRPISNLADTPFVLRGRTYASVEGFWQGLKFDAQKDRDRIARLSGKAAKRAGDDAPDREAFTFDGRTYAVGGPGHHGLMLEACRAKFGQNESAREALLATSGKRT